MGTVPHGYEVGIALYRCGSLIEYICKLKQRISLNSARLSESPVRLEEGYRKLAQFCTGSVVSSGFGGENIFEITLKTICRLTFQQSKISRSVHLQH